MFRFTGRGAILTGKRRVKKWVYIAAGVDGRRWSEELEDVVGDWSASLCDCTWTVGSREDKKYLE